MSGKDRRRYLTETVLDQEFLDWSADNLETKLEMIAEIDTPTGTIYASDRNKYVGSTFYEALLQFPTISRTVGEWLVPTVQFSNIKLELSNVDGRFNDILPQGANFSPLVGRQVTIKVGLDDIASTYKTIFSGFITEVGGVQRSVKSMTLVARDKYDELNKDFPRVVLTRDSNPKLGSDVVGAYLPVIYGDWTVSLDPDPAAVPSIVLNGGDPFIDFEDREVTVSISSPAVFTRENHNLDNGDVINLSTDGSLPTGLNDSTDYYVINRADDTFQVSTSPGGSAVNTSGSQSGTHSFAPAPGESRVNVALRISENDLVSFDTSNVWLSRSDSFYKVPSSEVVNVGGGNKTFEVVQDNAGALWVEGAEYLYEQGDIFLVRVKGKTLSGFDDNIVEQARDILITYGGLASGDFDASWDTFRDKSTPAQSSIATIKSRIWENEPKPIITFALSLLEQVRLEAFIDRNLKLKISSLHFEDFDASPSHKIRNWDVAKDTFKPKLNDRNNFNRARGNYDFHPNRNENAKATAIFVNPAATKEISKQIAFPNLYIQSDVENQLKEILKIASALFESSEVTLTWRSLLVDIGDFVSLDVKIGSTQFDGVPAKIRQVSYDPKGPSIPIVVWSNALLPFSGYEPGYSGTIGGYNATIEQE